MYPIVASDLDGTLLNPEHKLSAYTKKVLQALRERDINFVFATGRHHVDVAQMRANMEIDAFMITSNGARVHDSQGNLVLSRSVAPAIAYQIAQVAMDDVNIYTHIYRGDDWLVNKEDAYSLSFFDDKHFSYRLFDPIDFATDDIAKIYFTVTDDKQHSLLVDLKSRLQATYGDKISIAFSTLNCLEVMADNVSKGTALQYVSEKLGFTLVDCVAFGDGMNDYEMLSMAGQGYIMQDAISDLKARLPDMPMIGSNRDDAVPHFLSQLYGLTK